MELDHVQVVEGHKMPITAEDIHIPLGVNDCDVAIACGGLGSSDEAEFFFVVVRWIVVHTSELLSLLHLLVVLVKRMVRVFYNECVHHSNGSGRAETFTAGMSFLAASLIRRCSHKATARLERWTQSRAGTANRLSSSGTTLVGARWWIFTVIFLVHCTAASLGTSILIVVGLITLSEFHLREVEDQHVVQLLCQLKDAAKDVHLLTVYNGWVATSCAWAESSFLYLNLSPQARGSIKLPQVV